MPQISDDCLECINFDGEFCLETECRVGECFEPAPLDLTIERWGDIPDNECED